MTQKHNNNRFQNFFESKRAIQLICFGVALVFWILIKLSKPYRTTQEFALVYDKPPGTTFTVQPPESIIATLNGQGWDLLASYFSGNNRKLSIDLTNSAPRQTYFSTQLISKISQTNKDVLISGVNIDLLEINLENEVTKKVPIALASNFEYNSQYQLKEAIRIIPDSITIKGPVSILEQINHWETETWDSKDISGNLEKKLNLVNPDNSLIQIIPSQVNAQLIVEQLTEKALFVPISIKNAPDSLKIFPENIKLSCIVGLSKYNSLAASDFSLEVDLKGIMLNAADNTLPILLTRQPDYIKGVNMNHQSVEFFFVQSNPDSILNILSGQ